MRVHTHLDPCPSLIPGSAGGGNVEVMNTTQEVDVLGQKVTAEPPLTAEVCSTTTRSATDGTVRRARSVKHHRPRVLVRLVHALAQAGQSAVPDGYNSLVGPNGAVMWTATPTVGARSRRGGQGWER